MRRRLVLALALAALAAAGWQTLSPPRGTSTLAAETGDPRQLDDLMMDLNIAPLEPAAAPALTVSTVEGGGRVSLADVRGHAVLVYFWATW